MKDLEPKLKEQVVKLCEKGLTAQSEERFHASNQLFYEVYKLLPEPKHEWKAYFWLISNMADNHYEQDEFQAAFDKLQEVFDMYSESNGNAYLCLRFGQSAYELNNTDEAIEYLSRAKTLGGTDIFDGEHSKYAKFLKENG